MKISQSVERTHYLWVIALLLLILSFVVLRIPDGSLVRDYISFAASIASLVLAVVAIFYSIISSESFHQSIASLRESAGRVSDETQKLESTSAEFNRRADELVQEIKQVPLSVRENFAELGGKVETLISSAPKSGAESAASNDQDRKIIASLLALYVIARSFESGKVADTKKIGSSNFPSILFGYFCAVRDYCPLGIKMEGAGYSFQVRDIGSFDAKGHIEIVTKSDNTAVIKVRAEIDSYFGIEAPIEAGSDEDGIEPGNSVDGASETTPEA